MHMTMNYCNIWNTILNSVSNPATETTNGFFLAKNFRKRIHTSYDIDFYRPIWWSALLLTRQVVASRVVSYFLTRSVLTPPPTAHLNLFVILGRIKSNINYHNSEVISVKLPTQSVKYLYSRKWIMLLNTITVANITLFNTIEEPISTYWEKTYSIIKGTSKWSKWTEKRRLSTIQRICIKGNISDI
jgi:hypothetical protein